jgi:hypothetical protein
MYWDDTDTQATPLAGNLAFILVLLANNCKELELVMYSSGLNASPRAIILSEREPEIVDNFSLDAEYQPYT